MCIRDRDGTLLDVKTSLDELTPSLQAAIKAQAGSGSIEDIDKTFDDGDTSYVATITAPDGKDVYKRQHLQHTEYSRPRFQGFDENAHCLASPCFHTPGTHSPA